jgi:hypothetical protein
LATKPYDSALRRCGFLGVGVTGHRLDGLRNADWELLRARVREVLALTQQVAGRARAGLLKGDGRCGMPVRVISPLAAGADQIVAEEGLAAGCELHAPLPFQQEEYEKDFSTPESLGRFRHLVARASSVDVLGGKSESGAERGASYGAVGVEVLRLSNILLAIWNGRPAKGAGGTAQIVEEARAAGIPVIWVCSQAPHSLKILLPQRPWKDGSNREVVEEVVRCLSAEAGGMEPVFA